MKERRKGGLRSRQEQVANEILMYFRAQRKLQGEVSLSDTLDADGDGNALSLMDVIRVDDDMLENLDARDSCIQVRKYVEQCLSEREKKIITMRYGLDNRPPRTSARSPPKAASHGPMYRAAANVNEARKALWDKTSGLRV